MMYRIAYALRIVIGLAAGSVIGILIAVKSNPVVGMATGSVPLALLVGVWTASEDVRGRPRVYVFLAFFLGMGMAAAFLLH